MSFAIPLDVRQAKPQVFRHTVDGREVFVKQRRPGKNPVGRSAQRLLHAMTRNPLLLPAARSANNVRTEAANLRRAAAAGLPVPEVLHEEDDYFVMTNTGRKLERYLVAEPERRGEYIRRAAALLGRLHRQGLVHGGAQIRNFTKPEDGETISLIDFEETPPPGRLADFQLRDLFLLAFSLEKKRMAPGIRALAEAYAGDGPEASAVVAATSDRLCRALAALRPVAAADALVPAALRMADIRALGRLASAAARELRQG